MTHDKIVKDLERAHKAGALDGLPKLADSEIANFCRRLALSTANDADDLLMFADDILTNEGGNERALMLLDGMRDGIQQARAADRGDLVVAIWFGDNSARATFSWSGDEKPNKDLHEAIAQALNSALRANGEEAHADP